MTFKKEITLGDAALTVGLFVAGFAAYSDLKAGNKSSADAIVRHEKKMDEITASQSVDRQHCVELFDKINDSQNMLAVSLAKVQTALDERRK